MPATPEADEGDECGFMPTTPEADEGDKCGFMPTTPEADEGDKSSFYTLQQLSCPEPQSWAGGQPGVDLLDAVVVARSGHPQRVLASLLGLLLASYRHGSVVQWG